MSSTCSRKSGILRKSLVVQKLPKSLLLEDSPAGNDDIANKRTFCQQVVWQSCFILATGGIWAIIALIRSILRMWECSAGDADAAGGPATLTGLTGSSLSR